MSIPSIASCHAHERESVVSVACHTSSCDTENACDIDHASLANNHVAQSYIDLTLEYFVLLALSVSSVVDLFVTSSLSVFKVMKFVLI